MHIVDEFWAYLLRVGVDLTENGGFFHGPVFDDGSFEYIPIPEWEADSSYCKTVYGEFTYGNTVGRYRRHAFADYIQDKKDKKLLQNTHVHIDPDFRNHTYGDVAVRREGNSLKPISKAAS